MLERAVGFRFEAVEGRALWIPGAFLTFSTVVNIISLPS